MNAPFPIPRRAAFMPPHRASDLGIREPQTVRTLKRRERRAPNRQLVTKCNQLKTGGTRANQSVTIRHRLNMGCRIRQSVTDCHRLKMSPNLGNLISPP